MARTARFLRSALARRPRRRRRGLATCRPGAALARGWRDCRSARAPRSPRREVEALPLPAALLDELQTALPRSVSGPDRSGRRAVVGGGGGRGGGVVRGSARLVFRRGHARGGGAGGVAVRGERVVGPGGGVPAAARARAGRRAGGGDRAARGGGRGVGRALHRASGHGEPAARAGVGGARARRRRRVGAGGGGCVDGAAGRRRPARCRDLRADGGGALRHPNTDRPLPASSGSRRRGARAGRGGGARAGRTRPAGGAAGRASAGHRVDARGGPVLAAPGAAHHRPSGAPGRRGAAYGVGQLQHPGKLLRRHDAPHVLVCPPRLRHRLPPDDARRRHPGAHRRRARAGAGRAARPPPRARLLPHRPLVPRPAAAARLPPQQGRHGADDGPPAARRFCGEGRGAASRKAPPIARPRAARSPGCSPGLPASTPRWRAFTNRFERRTARSTAPACPSTRRPNSSTSRGGCGRRCWSGGRRPS